MEVSKASKNWWIGLTPKKMSRELSADSLTNAEQGGGIPKADNPFLPSATLAFP